MDKLSDTEIAELLYKSELNKKPIPPIAKRMKTESIENAYAIQELNTQRKIKEGEKLIGRKIGLTSLQVQEQLGVNQPDFGSLLTSFQIENKGTLHLPQLIQPKCEAEMAVVLQADIRTKTLSVEELVPFIMYVTPCIEIVDSRIENWNIGILDTVADNASSSRFVLGEEKVSPEKVNWEQAKMQLWANRETVSEGEGANCLGNPLNALLWLANTMIDLKMPLQKDEIILTGALGPMHSLTKSENIRAEIESLGEVELEVKL